MNEQQLDDLFDVYGGPVAPLPKFEEDLFARLEQELTRLDQAEDKPSVLAASDAEMSFEDLEVVITPLEREETMAANPSKLLLLAAAAIVVVAGIFLAIESGSDDSAPVISDEVPGENISESGSPARTEAFEYSSNGVTTRAKIHLPESFEPGMDLPTIYLIEFDSAGHPTAPEFETVIDSVNQVDGLNALVATLEEPPNITPSPSAYQEHAGLFRDMANHVDSTYTGNPSRTFIGRGFEAGIVLLELFGEGPEEAAFDNYVATDVGNALFAGEVRSILLSEDFSDATTSKRLHLSFSASNDVWLMTELADVIDEAEYPWLDFESVYYSDLDFEDAYPTAFTDGLAFVLGG